MPVSIIANSASPSPDLRARKQSIYILTDIAPFRDLELMLASDGVLSSLDELGDAEIGNSAFYVFFRVDEACVSAIRRIIACGGPSVPPMQFAKTTYSRVAAHVAETLKKESDRAVGQLFCGEELRENICQAVDMTRDVAGDFVEIGVFTGSSAVTAMTYMRNRGIARRCTLICMFEGFTYSEAADSADGIW